MFGRDDPALVGQRGRHAMHGCLRPPDSCLLSLLLLLTGLTGTGWSQYQLVREDPFAQLSATLQTRQAAACDGEVLGLDCPRGTKVRKHRLHSSTLHG